MFYPDSKVHGANMGPTWVLSAPGGPYVGPMNLAIRLYLYLVLKELLWRILLHCIDSDSDSKVHGANMGPTWVLSAPDGPHVGPMYLAIREPTWAVETGMDICVCRVGSGRRCPQPQMRWENRATSGWTCHRRWTDGCGPLTGKEESTSLLQCRHNTRRYLLTKTNTPTTIEPRDSHLSPTLFA